MCLRLEYELFPGMCVVVRYVYCWLDVYYIRLKYVFLAEVCVFGHSVCYLQECVLLMAGVCCW